MTEIAFHFNAPDRLAYACRVLKKARRLGAEVAVVGEGEVLDRLDRLLWTFEALEFLPHLRVRPGQVPPPRLAATTPIWLLERPDPSLRQPVLLNLGAHAPEGFERFSKVVEIVSTDPGEIESGRQRWRHYRALGYEIERHDVAA